MNELKTFFDMGGYGLYVWGSYGLTFIVLLANVLQPWLKQREIMARLTRKARRQRKQNDKTT